jgi:hypothetical protein
MSSAIAMNALPRPLIKRLRAGSQAPSVEMIHSPTDAKIGSRQRSSDYTSSVACKGVVCRHHVSGIHTPKGWIAAKSDATVTF